MKHDHSRRCSLAFTPPSPALHLVLVEPQIPPNTGNIARLCAATQTPLHLVEPLGFKLDDAKLKRAGLDYWDSVLQAVHPDFDTFLDTVQPNRCFFLTTAGAKSYHQASFQPGDALVFGSETQGLSADLLDRHPDHTLGIPIIAEHVRSLNLSGAASIVLYEALRQLNSF